MDDIINELNTFEVSAKDEPDSLNNIFKKLLSNIIKNKKI